MSIYGVAKEVFDRLVLGDVECAQQPGPHSPTGDLGEIAGVNGQNSEGMCLGGKPGTGKLYTDVCLCCSAHTSGCVVDTLGLRQRLSNTNMAIYFKTNNGKKGLYSDLV